MGADSGVSIQSTGGPVTFNSLLVQGALFGLNAVTGGAADASAAISSLLLPSSLSLVALDGDVAVEHGGGLYPSTTGTLTILADQSVDMDIPLVSGFDLKGNPLFSLPAFAQLGNVSGITLGKLDYPVGTGILPTASDPSLVDQSQLPPAQDHDPAMTQDDGDQVRIYALNGSIASGKPGDSRDI